MKNTRLIYSRSSFLLLYNITCTHRKLEISVIQSTEKYSLETVTFIAIVFFFFPLEKIYLNLKIAFSF
jgi:hypothetical protein